MLCFSPLRWSRIEKRGKFKLMWKSCISEWFLYHATISSGKVTHYGLEEMSNDKENTYTGFRRCMNIHYMRNHSNSWQLYISIFGAIRMSTKSHYSGGITNPLLFLQTSSFCPVSDEIFPPYPCFITSGTFEYISSIFAKDFHIFKIILQTDGIIFFVAFFHLNSIR